MSTPRIDLGSEQLSSALLSEVKITQSLNDHWTCHIRLRDTPDSRPQVEDFAGKPLKITTTALDGTETIVFSGYVRRMRLIYEVTGAYGAELEAISATWKLTQGRKLQYYYQQTAQAAAQKALSGCGISVQGSMAAGATLSYVQWDESDFDFFARLVDDGEAWFRPAVDGSDAVEVQTAFQSGVQVNWREGEYGLLEWTTRGQLQPIAAQGANYDPQVMQSKATNGVTSSTPFYGSAAEKMVSAVQGKSGMLEARWVDRNRAATLSDLQSRLEREARRGLASAVTCTGISREPRVRAGDTLAVTGLPGVDATYGVLEVVHHWTSKGYENSFTVTPAERWSPVERPRRPMLDGVYPARVVDNYDPHNQGRIRVQYYWQEDNETTWVRMIAAHAGAGRGFLFLPEKGDEVMITFEEGDAERPYVVGSAWNGVHQPPANGFHQPSEVNGSEFAANNIKRIVTKSGHRITMVDTPGSETISLTTPRSNRVMLTENHEDTGRPAIVLESEGDMIFAAPNGRIHSQSKFHSRDVGKG
jgi:type VI secretion system secreted protein VgrG